MQVMTGRIFVVLVTAVAYVIALRIPQSIFDVATQYAFAGYAALVPLLVAALFWKNSTRWGALATTLWTAAAVMAVAVIQNTIAAPPPGTSVVVWAIGDWAIVTRGAAGTFVIGMLPVVPMTLISAMLMIVVSLATKEFAKPGETPHCDATSLTQSRGLAMKVYVVTTGTIFGLLTVAHLAWSKETHVPRSFFILVTLAQGPARLRVRALGAMCSKTRDRTRRRLRVRFQRRTCSAVCWTARELDSRF